MLNMIDTVNYLRMSLVLKDPKIETDVAYKFTDDELWDIVQLVVPSHNPSYTVDNFPENEKYFAILLAKKEIYYRLATASAPFYPLQAEGAELRKDYRFEHYMSLIRRVEVEYEQMWGNFNSNKVVDVGNVLLIGKHFTKRNYELASKPNVNLSIDSIRTNEVDISWSKFDVPCGMFDSYTIFISNSPIYDDYEDKVDSGATKVEVIRDIHKTKYRIKGLSSKNTYYVAVVSEDLNKLAGVSELQFDTE